MTESGVASGADVGKSEREVRAGGVDRGGSELKAERGARVVERKQLSAGV